jgi:predicted RNase H-like nuclease (RuvC/YqgF family)
MIDSDGALYTTALAVGVLTGITAWLWLRLQRMHRPSDEITAKSRPGPSARQTIEQLWRERDGLQRECEELKERCEALTAELEAAKRTPRRRVTHLRLVRKPRSTP